MKIESVTRPCDAIYGWLLIIILLEHDGTIKFTICFQLFSQEFVLQRGAMGAKDQSPSL